MVIIILILYHSPLQYDFANSPIGSNINVSTTWIWIYPDFLYPLEYLQTILQAENWMCFPDSSVGKESACNAGDPGSILGLERSAGEEKKLPTPVFCLREVHGVTKSWTDWVTFTLGFPCGSAGKESTCNAGDLGSIPRLGRSPGEGKRYPL